MSMIDTIKKASMGVVGASNPVNILFGEILDIDAVTVEKTIGEPHCFKTHIDKIEIKVDQKIILDEDFFIIPERLTRYEVDLKHKHTITNGSTGNSLNKIVIREGLKQGDKVLLLRVQGGQQYVILDRVV